MQNTNLVFNSLTSTEELTKQVNKVRLANKNKWYQISFENETTGKLTRLKIYNTWIQITENVHFETGMDYTITEFKENVKKGVTNLIKQY